MQNNTELNVETTKQVMTGVRNKGKKEMKMFSNKMRTQLLEN